MTESEKMQRAKEYMDKMSDGIDPITGAEVDANTLRNGRVIACMQYISSVLQNDIDVSIKREIRKNCGKKAVYISDQQKMQLQPFSTRCKVSQISDEINKVILKNGTKKFHAVWINDWLEGIGMLERDAVGQRIASEQGRKLGITSELRRSQDKTEYYVNYYAPEAQDFIYSNIDAILCTNYGTDTIISEDFEHIDFPADTDILHFLHSHPDTCFIIALGSCDSVNRSGGYTSVLLFRGKTKILRQSNLSENSANRCILFGIRDAAQMIKAPTNVMILASTSLGFETPKSKNYPICCDIINILKEKHCQISVCACLGKGEDLKKFVQSCR